ncbi:TPR repeat family protein [Orientia tsutsugamushi str. Gilliam]|nr:tetratricopeptide repeat protein [Orientia tsutsugamushi]KJV51565.1 TPR repeat family protein [Orientia tsutsugamushi str. Gilliam]
MAIKYNPNYAKAYYNKGVCLNKLEQYKEAIENYDLAIKYNPNDAKAYYNKGLCLNELEQYKEAMENFN